jgi:hypothetical protein
MEYKVLESSPNDDMDEIKQKYYKKMRECHPDKNVNCEEMAKKLNMAWNYIKANHNEPVPKNTVCATLGESVRVEYQREMTKLENNKTLSDKECDDGFMDIIYKYLFN